MGLSKTDKVKLIGLNPNMFFAMVVCNEVYHEANVDCVITSACDGVHGQHSHHYKGCAIDLRTSDLSKEQLTMVPDTIQKRLGSDFQVILENNHLHIEFDPA